MKIHKTIDITGILGSFLLVQFCPICIPAIGAFLASIGLGFLLTTKILHGLLIFMLILAVGGIAFSVFKEHKKIGPLLLALPGAVFIYLARWVLLNNMWLYLGVVLLMSASIWNLWLRKKMSCQACKTT